MQIDISGDAEQRLLRNAALAGFDDAREYVLSLIFEDEPDASDVMPAPNDPRIIKAIDEGYASGVAGDAKDIIPEIRARLERRIAGRKQDGD